MEIFKELLHVRNDIPEKFNEREIIFKEWPRVYNIFMNKIVPPYEVLIHSSSKCNLHCNWCIGKNVDEVVNTIPDKLKNVENMIKLVKGIVDYKKNVTYVEDGFEKEIELNVKNVSYSGIIGEPLVAKAATLAGIDYLNKHGVRTGLFTNGLLMQEDTYNVLKDAGYVLVSIDAGNNETYYKSKCIGLDDRINYSNFAHKF